LEILTENEIDTNSAACENQNMIIDQ